MKAAFSLSLQMLWDYINSLQMIALIPLMNLSLPPNLLKMLSYIAGPLSFNYLQETNLAPFLFHLDPSKYKYPTYNQAFSDFGFDTSLAVLNLQDTVVYLTIFILGFPLTLILSQVPKVQENKYASKIVKNMRRLFMYGFILRLFIENFMPIFLSCLVNMQIRDFNTYGEKSSTAFAFILFVSLLRIHIFIVHYAWKSGLGQLSDLQAEAEP